MDKGVAFPTCVSVNECVCHNSPLPSEPQEPIKEGDVVKVDLGVHIDGYVAVVAHTVVAGACVRLSAPLTHLHLIWSSFSPLTSISLRPRPDGGGAHRGPDGGRVHGGHHGGRGGGQAHQAGQHQHAGGWVDYGGWCWNGSNIHILILPWRCISPVCPFHGSVQVTEAIGKVAAAYGVNAMQGTLMHQMKRSVRLRFVLGTIFVVSGCIFICTCMCGWVLCTLGGHTTVAVTAGLRKATAAPFGGRRRRPHERRL